MQDFHEWLRWSRHKTPLPYTLFTITLVTATTICYCENETCLEHILTLPQTYFLLSIHSNFLNSLNLYENTVSFKMNTKKFPATVYIQAFFSGKTAIRLSSQLSLVINPPLP